MAKSNTKKKDISKRQKASIARHTKKYGASHGKTMKRYMMLGAGVREAHKKANNK
tara:strand:+ start:499 stop:663 length:165 start_codon:yes stop_codon:yes gene_type:complete